MTKNDVYSVITFDLIYHLNPIWLMTCCVLILPLAFVLLHLWYCFLLYIYIFDFHFFMRLLNSFCHPPGTAESNCYWFVMQYRSLYILHFLCCSLQKKKFEGWFYNHCNTINNFFHTSCSELSMMYCYSMLPLLICILDLQCYSLQKKKKMTEQ